VRLGEVVQESVRLLRRTFPAGIELKVAVSPEPVWVLADTTQINQVVMNLAINARDAMPVGGRLTIGVDEDRPRQAGGGGDGSTGGGSERLQPVARLTVSDTGTGMPPEVLARVFEPFFTTKPAGEGTGLGLSIIHGIVENHAGRIEVDSQPGRGTTFRVLLPLSDPAAVDATQDQPGSARTGKGELILLADDHTYVREIVASMLQTMGYRVAQADDGLALLELSAAHLQSARLLIVDSEMPGLGGIETIATLRRRRAGSVPAILMAGSPECPIDADPATVVIRKPFQMNELAEAVAKALQPSP
jgi:CheY-like chemotaxis protein